MKEMKEGRIILIAKLTNISAIGIGSGRDDHSDRDIIKTLYPIGTTGAILPLEEIKDETKFERYPFIPATSFMGKLNRLISDETNINKITLKNYWGESEENASYIDCSDILLSKLPIDSGNSVNLTETRDGIRIDSKTGTVAKGAKFDYELLGRGGEFNLTMIFRVEDNFNFTHELASLVVKYLKSGIDLGAKSTVGFGKIVGEANLFQIDFEKQDQLKQWISNKLTHNALSALNNIQSIHLNNPFEISATLRIKNSLIIRSYSTDPKQPDATHLKSGGTNIISGTSIKGALRGRAERILNTIQPSADITEVVLAALFGDVEKDEKDKQKVKPNGYTIPSRVFVDEITIDDDTVREEIQTRIQIDRFTGGTIDGALIEEVPLFPVKDKDQIKNFKIRVNNARSIDKGLMLLLLKDLWSADLPIGGEKSIGRGVFEGIHASVEDGNKKYIFPDDLKNSEKIKEMQDLVEKFNSLDDIEFYQNRVNLYKTRRNGK